MPSIIIKILESHIDENGITVIDKCELAGVSPDLPIKCDHEWEHKNRFTYFDYYQCTKCKIKQY